MIANTGRAPLLSLVPALLVGLVIGSAQYVLLSHVRPHAVEAQGEAGFRYYGPRFNQSLSRHVWEDFDGTMVNAAIDFTPDGPVLTDLRLFVLGPQNRFQRAVWADRAYPVAGGLALAGNIARWPFDPDASDRETLVINRDWLGWAQVEPRLVPHSVLRRIAEAEAGVPLQTAYRAALLERSAAIAGAVAMALMVSSLCLHWMTTRSGLLVPGTILAAGYGLHLAGNVFSVLGEYGRVSPMVASWSLPVAVLILCLGAVVARHWSVMRRLRTLRVDD
jgi:lipopolysaccharide export LptBFGC system permease protein LptF